jgi:predicted phosphate transport protein (TIGR00153 family)
LQMESIEGWMRNRKEAKAISMIREHSKSTVVAIEQLQRCIEYANKGRVEEVKRAFAVLQLKEKEADDMKRQIVAELAKGDLPSKVREDLIRLARENDQVISWINEAGRILVEFNFRDMPDGVKNIVDEMVKVLHACVVKLDECMGKLMDREFKDALKAADEVENREEEMDALYQRCRSLILAFDKSDIGVGSAILLAEFLEGLENITDRCEDTADEIRAIAVVFSS